MSEDRLRFDSVAGNVVDLEAALKTLRAATGLEPFLRFELVDDDKTVPVALVKVGDASLELLGHVSPTDHAGAARITGVRLSVKGIEATTVELGAGCTLEVQPGPEKRVAGISVESATADSDADLLTRVCRSQGVASDDSRVSCIDGVEIRFSDRAPARSTTETETAEGEYFAGWHRLGLTCSDLESTLTRLEGLGLAPMVPAYNVLPGLDEALLQLPSGLVIQPVRQRLWKMLPVIGSKKIVAALTHRPIRFATT